MTHRILWRPEPGTCSVCRARSSQVRTYSAQGTCQMVCFGCWKAHEMGCTVTRAEWHDDVSYQFAMEDGNGGAAQGAGPN